MRARVGATMAGASGSGEEMQTGRVNRAEGRTIVWAQVEPDVADFDGPAILIAEVAGDAEDPDDYEDGASFIPSNAFHGVLATGKSASGFAGSPPAHGVIGRGGRKSGSGVVGLGGGVPEPDSAGEGGIGVHGLGGSQAVVFPDPDTPPGAGVVGQGGRQSEGENTARSLHAAGVIGLAGGTGPSHDDLPAHPLAETGGIGVYGKGADAKVVQVQTFDETGTAGPVVASGPAVPGAGVVGRGGVSDEPRMPAAAGIVGVSGASPVPPISATGDVGVVGQGASGAGERSIGVLGRSADGPGVRGTSSDSRGGVFESARAAQLRLVPHQAGRVFGPTTASSPRELLAEREGELHLPKRGAAGDIIAVVDDDGACAYWCCVRGEGAGPARWAQMLLGAPFDGDS